MTSRPEKTNARRLILLGSTGSIGTNVLAVVEHLRSEGDFEFQIAGLAAGNNAALLDEQARRFRVAHVAIADAKQAEVLTGTGGRGGGGTLRNVLAGPDAALELIESIAQPGDLVLCAMVGAAGLPATLAAIDRGCDIALANKETLVAAGSIVMPRVAARGVRLLPIDSEHSAIFQCLEARGEVTSDERRMTSEKEVTSDERRVTSEREGPSVEYRVPGKKVSSVDAPHSSLVTRHSSLSSVRRIVITGSGGPFRTWTRQQMATATVEQALNHPTWSMGRKITIDSATLMNKALEVIEAHWLFGLPASKIQVIIHPQSIVHGFVEFVDGSVVAQLGPPDMRTPIQYALTWPRRAGGCARTMDWSTLGPMEFEPVDHDRFPVVKLADQVIEAGGSAGAVFNAANEAAVMAFLDGRIAFPRVTELVREALESLECRPVSDLSDVLRADRAAREWVERRIAGGGGTSTGADVAAVHGRR